MKPKYSRFLRIAFPSLVVIPAMMQLASAAVIAPNSFGNVLVTSTDNGANHILIPAAQPSGLHEIRFDPGTFLSPDGAASIDIRVVNGAGASYKIALGTGSSIQGGTSAGITTANTVGTAANLVVNANGTITGATGISGGLGAITVANDSSITGTAGAGISSTGTVNLTNGNFQFGIGRTVSGSTDGVVGTGDGSSIDNYGAITGQGGDGVRVGNAANVRNLTGINFGGQITGSTNGVVAGNNLTLGNSNRGSINGIGGDGIHTGNIAGITNDLGATITGNDNGIYAGDGLTLNNRGTIEGRTNSGVDAGMNSTISNDGTITGNGGINNGALNSTIAASEIGVGGSAITIGANSTINNTGTIISNGGDGIQVFAAGGEGSVGGAQVFGAGPQVLETAADTFILNNSGLVQGASSSFMGGLTDDTLNLNFGSSLRGDVIGGGGTDTINFGAGLTAPGGTSNYIEGNVLGFASINKASGGVAFIGLPGLWEGQPEFAVSLSPINKSVTADSINITGGGLYINADIAGYNVAQSTINAGGAALGGTGTWNANVNVTGTGGFSAGAIPINLAVNPLDAVGRVTITGDVVHAATSFIRYDFVPQGGALTMSATGNSIQTVLLPLPQTADSIVQTGAGNTYNMGGGYIRLSATDNNRVLRDGRHVIVQSDENILGSVQGRPDVQFNNNVTNNDTGFVGSEARLGGNSGDTVLGGYFSTVAIEGKQIVLNVTHDFESLATSSNSASLGRALDLSIESSNPIAQDFIAALDYSDLRNVQTTLAGLTPDTTFSTAAAIVSGNYRLNRIVQDHLAMTRTGDGATRSYVGSFSGPAPAPAPQPRSSGLGNVWGTASYAWKDVNSSSSRSLDGEEASFTAGADYRVGPDFLLGIVLDGSTANYDYSGGGSDVDSFRAAIYGTYGKPTGIYSDFLLGYGRHSMNLDRKGGILLGNMNSDTNADSFQAMLTVGYAMQAGAVKHGPFAGLEYQNVNVDSYTQKGVFPISVSGYDVDSLRLIAGYRVEGSYDRFTPYASVAYAHEFDDNSINTSATLLGGSKFRLSGGGLGSSILISVGTNYAFTPALSMNVGYQGEISVESEGTDSNGASIGLNYGF